MPEQVVQALKDAIDRTAAELVALEEEPEPHKAVSRLVARAISRMLEDYPPDSIAVIEAFRGRGYACAETSYLPTWEVRDGKFCLNAGHSVRARYWVYGEPTPRWMSARDVREMLEKIEALPMQDNIGWPDTRGATW